MNYSNRPYQICARCVMDTSDPCISFDDQGICNLCTEFLDGRIQLCQKDKASPDSLQEVIDHIKLKAKGAKYDCVMGISGGVDSSYAIYLAVKHGLRVLAVHMDNGWDSPVAVKNIRNVTKNLGVDYVTYVLPWNEFRQVQLAFLEASVPEAETPTDIAIPRAIYSYAAKEGVPFVISGGNMTDEGILPISWHYNARDTKYSYSILKHSGYKTSLYKSVKYGLLDEFYYLILKRIKTVYLLNYVFYDKKEACLILEKELGWEKYPYKHGESRFTRFIQSYYMFVKHGIDYRRATYSSQIFFGLIDRASALESLSSLPYEPEEIELDKEYIAKKLKIEKEYIEEIIQRPPKWYFDYDNNLSLLRFVYNTYRFLHGKKKSSNF